jgi:hypothetical protein
MIITENLGQIAKVIGEEVQRQEDTLIHVAYMTQAWVYAA